MDQNGNDVTVGTGSNAICQLLDHQMRFDDTATRLLCRLLADAVTPTAPDTHRVPVNYVDKDAQQHILQAFQVLAVLEERREIRRAVVGSLKAGTCARDRSTKRVVVESDGKVGCWEHWRRCLINGMTGGVAILAVFLFFVCAIIDGSR